MNWIVGTETKNVNCQHCSKNFRINFYGMKRAHNHVGNLKSYSWDKNNCIEEVERYPADYNINYSDLARRFDLKNKNGN